MASLTMTQTPVIGVAPITNQDDMDCAKDMMRQIHQQILLDIKTGNCKPKEGTRRYNMTARMLSQPMCDETTKKRYVFWRAKYNKRKRYEKTLFTAYNEAVAANTRTRLAAMREVADLSGDFRSVAPPESQRQRPSDGVVPRVPGYTPSYTGGETKEPPMAEECIPIPMAEIDFGKPLLIISANEQVEYANDFYGDFSQIVVERLCGNPPAENQPPIRRRSRLLSPQLFTYD
jgi:hypothetical protein